MASVLTLPRKRARRLLCGDPVARGYVSLRDCYTVLLILGTERITVRTDLEP